MSNAGLQDVGEHNKLQACIEANQCMLGLSIFQVFLEGCSLGLLRMHATRHLPHLLRLYQTNNAAVPRACPPPQNVFEPQTVQRIREWQDEQSTLVGELVKKHR